MSDLPQAARDYLDVIDRELARVSQVATQTLRFHRLSTSGLKVTPDKLIQEVLQLYAARLSNYNITAKRDYGAGLSFTCMEGDVRQILNNLVGNAVDMLKTGGILTVRTREATRWSTGQKGIRITLADSGKGICAGSSVAPVRRLLHHQRHTRNRSRSLDLLPYRSQASRLHSKL